MEGLGTGIRIFGCKIGIVSKRFFVYTKPILILTLTLILTSTEQVKRQMEEKYIKEKYMKEALRQAKKAAALGEVPIGCVIEYEGKIIGRGYNRRMVDKTALAHAEITAIRKACKYMGDWRLEGCTIYITLEPCPMCAGAIVQARIPFVVIGSMNPKAGCAGSVLNLLQEKGFNHQAEVKTGVLQEECSKMLSAFFQELRKKKGKKNAAVIQETDTADEPSEPK